VQADRVDVESMLSDCRRADKLLHTLR